MSMHMTKRMTQRQHRTLRWSNDVQQFIIVVHVVPWVRIQMTGCPGAGHMGGIQFVRIGSAPLRHQSLPATEIRQTNIIDAGYLWKYRRWVFCRRYFKEIVVKLNRLSSHEHRKKTTIKFYFRPTIWFITANSPSSLELNKLYNMLGMTSKKMSNKFTCHAEYPVFLVSLLFGSHNITLNTDLTKS